MSKEQLQFRKVHPDILQARKEAEEEYSEFFKAFHPYIKQSSSHILREIYAFEGATGYFIRVDIEAPESVLAIMRRWVDTLNAGSPPITYEDAIQEVRRLCERHKKEHGGYPYSLTVNSEMFRALHGMGKQHIMLPMLDPSLLIRPGVVPDTVVPDTIALVQVLSED